MSNPALKIWNVFYLQHSFHSILSQSFVLFYLQQTHLDLNDIATLPKPWSSCSIFFYIKNSWVMQAYCSFSTYYSSYFQYFHCVSLTNPTLYFHYISVFLVTAILHVVFALTWNRITSLFHLLQKKRNGSYHLYLGQNNTWARICRKHGKKRMKKKMKGKENVTSSSLRFAIHFTKDVRN